ncbi:rhamnose-binding lectin-like isoform X2 [Alosa alosa]|uniref:rhamnose-binding lectin-like isoform X2 n=1 Tax=Alosa alosa TaxID=278164 RepID=UPI00201519CC|nr:rhamnose-binding lectin-like isoform X2 [Alosa alosa]
MESAIKLTLISLVICACSVGTKAKYTQGCEDRYTSLDCGSDLIDVQLASYGRTDRITCSDGRSCHELSNTSCSAPSSLSEVKKRCDGRMTCMVKASSLIFSDPCAGISKYLEVLYRCVSPEERTSQTCEGGEGKLECGSNVIHIHDASYGRTDETTCSSGRPAHQLSNTNCYAPTTLPIIRERCEGRSTCTVHSSNHIFTDPCFGTYKYLHISYSCVPPSSKVIQIQAANYGRTDGTTCADGTNPSQVNNTSCFSTNTLSDMRQMCQGKSSCEVRATNAELSNPCPGTHKYLNISYSCTSNSSQICEGDAMRINCGSNHFIKIHEANYGRTDVTICSQEHPAHRISNTTCYSPNALSVVRNSCEGEVRCTITVSNSIFSNPCPGTHKYLDVTYSCVPPISSQTCEGNSTILDCGPNVISIHTANYGRTNRDICSAGQPVEAVSNTNCRTSRTRPKLQDMCDGKPTCKVTASSSTFFTPRNCEDTYKYLDLSYSCKAPSSP